MYLTAVALIITGSLSLYVRIWRAEYSSYSLADCFVAIQNVWEFGILIATVMVIFLLHFFRLEDMTNFMIRAESRRILWNKYAYKSILFSVMMTLYVQTCIFIVGGLASKSYINWSQQGTVYFEQTENHTNTVSFLAFLLIASVMVFLKFLNMSLLVALSSWAMKRREFFIVIVVMAAGGEYFLRDIPVRIFFSIINISYDKWLTGWPLYFGILYGILLAIVLWCFGMNYAKRKDFLDEER